MLRELTTELQSVPTILSRVVAIQGELGTFPLLIDVGFILFIPKTIKQPLNN